MPIHRHTRFAADLPALPLEPGETKQQWIYRQIARAIDAGSLQPGDSVPSTRALAARWEVSRGVVEVAFERLISEGYLVAAVGSGTSVSAAPPQRFLQARPVPVEKALVDGQGGRDPAARGDAAELPRPPSNPVRAGQPFIARLPDVQGFNLHEWQTSVARASRELAPENLDDADPRGLLVLREEVCKHLALSRGLRCEPQGVMIVTGIRHAIDLCAQAAISAGGCVALEDPGYAGADAIFQLRGLQTVDIPLDDEGISMDALGPSRVEMVYVTPAHQAPTGVAMSVRRRAELLAWAETTGTWVLEDDYDSDFSYERAPWPALKSQDQAGRVVFCGSFNKTLFPGLRIGYIVAPAALMPRLMEIRAATGRSNPVLDQLSMAEYMRSGALLRHLRKTRMAYKARRDLVVQELLAAGWPADDMQGLHAGFHFVLRLPPNTEEDALITRLGEAGIVVQSIRAFWRGKTPTPPPALVIGYTALSDAQAKWAARQLAGEFHDRVGK